MNADFQSRYTSYLQKAKNILNDLGTLAELEEYQKLAVPIYDDGRRYFHISPGKSTNIESLAPVDDNPASFNHLSWKIADFAYQNLKPYMSLPTGEHLLQTTSRVFSKFFTSTTASYDATYGHLEELRRETEEIIEGQSEFTPNFFFQMPELKRKYLELLNELKEAWELVTNSNVKGLQALQKTYGDKEADIKNFISMIVTSSKFRQDRRLCLIEKIQAKIREVFIGQVQIPDIPNVEISYPNPQIDGGIHPESLFQIAGRADYKINASWMFEDRFAIATEIPEYQSKANFLEMLWHSNARIVMDIGGKLNDWRDVNVKVEDSIKVDSMFYDGRNPSLKLFFNKEKRCVKLFFKYPDQYDPSSLRDSLGWLFEKSQKDLISWDNHPLIICSPRNQKNYAIKILIAIKMLRLATNLGTSLDKAFQQALSEIRDSYTNFQIDFKKEDYEEIWKAVVSFLRSRGIAPPAVSNGAAQAASVNG